MRICRMVAFVGCWLVAVACTKADEPAPKAEAKLEAEILAARKSRLHWAEEAFKSAAARPLDFEPLMDTIAASQELLEAKLDLAATPDERISALEAHLATLEKLRAEVNERFKSGKRGGSTFNNAVVHREYEAARVRLLKARLANLADAAATSELTIQLTLARKGRVEWAQQVLGVAGVGGGPNEFDSTGDMIAAGKALLQAQLDASTNYAERIAALQQHSHRLENTREKTYALKRTGSRGGEDFIYDRISRECEAVKLQLIEAQLAAETEAN